MHCIVHCGVLWMRLSFAAAVVCDEWLQAELSKYCDCQHVLVHFIRLNQIS